ncbi:cAMP responsive element modulator b isoform X2 [Trichomycterus rosablanca]|uniref:cAMP responsive element modulator b isoform X2 n=1 Tax=Trichomycterus rosablanca TaxID=2290929 RepID=UPI002F360E06
MRQQCYPPSHLKISMDTKFAHAQVQTQIHLSRTTDSAFQQQALVSPRNEKCQVDMLDLNKEKVFFSKYPDRRNFGLERPVVPMVADRSDEGASSASARVPDFYNPELKHFGSVQIDSSQQSYHTFSMSTLINSQTGDQYATQSGNSNHHSYAPSDKVVTRGTTGDMSAYQMSSPMSSLSQGVGMVTSTGPLLSPLQSSLHSSQQLDEEASRKKELRLLKNRVAAKECRRRKKQYLQCLEQRLSMLEMQNKKLMDELEYMKEICARKSSCCTHVCVKKEK